MIRNTSTLRWTALLLLLGLVLRGAVALPLNHVAEYTAGGGDTAWYLANGEGLLSGQNRGVSRFGIPFYVEALPNPPLYLAFVGIWQKIPNDTLAIVGIRLSQIFLSLGTAYLISQMASAVAKDGRAGLIALFVMCFDPAQIVEPRIISTESLYLFLIALGLWGYLRTVLGDQPATWQGMVGVAIALGLATLTRAVGILFPLALVAHLWLLWRTDWRKWARYSLVLIGVYGAVISTWTVYSALRFNRFVIVSTQLMPAIWRGAVSNDSTPQQNDALLIKPDETPQDCTQDCKFQVPTQTYVEQTSTVITSNVLGYLQARFSELVGAYLQPHTATLLGGESLKDLAVHWLRDDFTLAGLGRLLNGDNFWVKGLIYVFQYSGLGLGLIALAIGRQHWRACFVPLSFIVYTTLIHMVLLVLPRYIFPVVMCYWVLAPITLLWAWDRMKRLAFFQRG